MKVWIEKKINDCIELTKSIDEISVSFSLRFGYDVSCC